MLSEISSTAGVSMAESIGPNGLTREARLYTLKELARRAAVRPDEFSSWQIEIGSQQTLIQLPPGDKTVRFKHAPSDAWEKLRHQNLDALLSAKFSWMFDPAGSIREAIPNFVVPYSSTSTDIDHRPLFVPVSRDVVECEIDLLLTVLLVLSRAEELATSERDHHGRFAAVSSLAYRQGFLNRPIIDEYGLAFEQALSYLMPGWRGQERSLRVKLSHDIDVVGIPFQLRPTLGHTFLRRRPLATARDLFAGIADLQPTCLGLVERIVSLAMRYGLRSAVYWKASPPGPNDSGYDPRHAQIRTVISSLEDQGLENGFHPGYETFQRRERLGEEVETLRQVLGDQALGGRQHYLRWAPQTWQDWEECGLAYDSTVGYADRTGFRAGTCIPYRPWLLWQNREADLLEIPLIVMECVPIVRMGLTRDETLHLIEGYVRTCRLVGGVSTLLWHNASLIEPSYGNLYERVLERLSGCETFDGRNSTEFHATPAQPACA
jgi:hypothetical protein